MPVYFTQRTRYRKILDNILLYQGQQLSWRVRAKSLSIIFLEMLPMVRYALRVPPKAASYLYLNSNTQVQALGVKVVPTSEIVSIALDAGYDSLFIELEHSSFSLSQVSQLCAAGIMSGITPFVRVPHQCGNGFVQRVLDGGAMGIIFPHISSVGR